jgi:AcrR family transcriptional regulator
MTSTTSGTPRDRAKAERTDALLAAAAALFAERGYPGVSLEEIGSAVGVSGPAVYRHFPGKQALLGEVLLRVSDDLVTGGTAVSESAEDAPARMRALIRFHVNFALTGAEVIRVHDRDIVHLSAADRAEVRRLQRAYIALWIDAAGQLLPADPEQLRLRVQACFGLLNSTPHSTRATARAQAETARLLEAMAFAALLASE